MLRLLVTVVGIFCAIAIRAAQAQTAKAPTATFYILAHNIVDDSETIFEAKYPIRQASKILTLPRWTSITARVGLSSKEFRLLQEDDRSQTLLFDEDKSNVFIEQNIQGVWLLDPSHLLILKFNYVGNMLKDHGYYEFIILNKITGMIISLFNLDAHYEMPGSWVDCYSPVPPSPVSIQQVLPHPQLDMFAFSIRSVSRYGCGAFIPYQIFIVDYSSYPVEVKIISRGEGISWSLDGGKLAYLTRDYCNDESQCLTSLWVASTEALDSPTLFQRAMFSGHASIFTAWLDNETLLYEWTEIPEGDVSPVIATINVIDKFRIIVSDPASFGRIYVLGKKPPALVGEGDQSLLAVRMPEFAAFPIALMPVADIAYNSRYNDTVIVAFDNRQAYQSDYMIVDHQLRRSMLDFSQYLSHPEFANFKVWAVFPGEGIPLPEIEQITP